MVQLRLAHRKLPYNLSENEYVEAVNPILEKYSCKLDYFSQGTIKYNLLLQVYCVVK